MAGPFVPQPPPRTAIVDWRSVVSAVDPRYQDPTIVYEMANGRKFKEFPPSQVEQTLYASKDGTALYQPNPSPSLANGPVFYAPRTS